MVGRSVRIRVSAGTVTYVTLNTPAAEFAPHGARPVWVYLAGGLHASESIALCIDRNDNDIITSMRCDSISKTSTQQGRAGVEGGWRLCGMYSRDCVRAGRRVHPRGGRTMVWMETDTNRDTGRTHVLKNEKNMLPPFIGRSARRGQVHKTSARYAARQLKCLRARRLLGLECRRSCPFVSSLAPVIRPAPSAHGTKLRRSQVWRHRRT